MSKRRHGGATRAVGLGRRLANRERELLAYPRSTAAGASPSARHRWPSVGHLVHHAVRRSAGGLLVSSSCRLCSTTAGGTTRGSSATRTSFRAIPEIGYSDESVTLQCGSFRVRRASHSGHRPLLLVADAVDDYLVSTIGFGVRHYTELALRFADYAIGHIEPAWPAGDLDVTEPVRVAANEVEAATTLLRAPLPNDMLASPESRVAYDWATAATDSLTFDVTHPESSLTLLRSEAAWASTPAGTPILAAVGVPARGRRPRGRPACWIGLGGRP